MGAAVRLRRTLLGLTPPSPVPTRIACLASVLGSAVFPMKSHGVLSHGIYSIN